LVKNNEHGLLCTAYKAIFRRRTFLAGSIAYYKNAPLPQLIAAAHALRMKLHPENEVSWIIDRNVNISNVCITGCRFCNFSCSKNSPSAYVTSRDEYRKK